MRSFTAIFSIVTLALGVIGSPEPEATSQYELVKRSCNSGSVQCCNNIQSTSSTSFSRNTYFYLLFLGFTPAQIVALAQAQNSNGGTAVVCSGSGSVSCNQQNVCCNGSHFSGLNVQACNAVNVA
ncbi:hypothetical protein PENSPDRAFT_691705 [Peniophora sp. CONT]|nr:hypothetical protein PENSPDRAFT_691705 [Peniophora sp. CONT]